MLSLKIAKIPVRLALITLVLFCSSCAGKYQNERFTFKAPGGTKIETIILDGQTKLFLKPGNLYFAVTQQQIPPGRSVQEIYQDYRTTTEGRMDQYQFISEAEVEFIGLPAIEYIYSGFSGEPYVQRRELWLEKDGWAYQLMCSDPVGVPPPGLGIPVDEGCYRLAEGFVFKD